MARGKNINLYLMDGTANGRIKCTLANWTGVAYKIPRTELDKCKERDDLKWSGVYFLFGTSDETGKSIAYIGQAGVRKNGEGILNRLLEHKRNPEKDYWTEAVVFTTSNNSFGPTEISYLENRFCNLAIDANRYVVKNGNDPSPGHITEEKESELEEFAEYAKLIMGTLGHKVFIPLIQESKSIDSASENSDDEEPQLYLSRTIKKIKFTVKAMGKQTSDGFVVLKGSLISPMDAEYLSKGDLERRKQRRVDDNNVLLEDMLFNTPSGAATFAIGKNANGWNEWKTKDGKTLHDLESDEEIS
ncbi:MAG: GIY-YIG nuclease family protein [Lachnospiraceae bacterium]|nr:GIY-YIG nuclease family protein [Ruminococcus sp.]MCM1276457.1 GIY-YIG nuclease family protein [Lachnospiraceae bacterium]